MGAGESESGEGEEEHPHGEPCLGLWGQVWVLRLEVEAGGWESEGEEERPHGVPCLGFWDQVGVLRLEGEAGGWESGEAAGESRLSWVWAQGRPHRAS